MQLLKLPPKRLVGHNLGLNLNSPHKSINLGLHLLFGSIGIDLAQAPLGFISLAMGNKLTGRFRASRKKSGQNDGWDASNGNHISPAVGNVGKGGTKAV